MMRSHTANIEILETVPRLLALGLSMEQVAQALELTVAYRGSFTSQQYTAIAQAIQQIIEPNQNLNQ